MKILGKQGLLYNLLGIIIYFISPFVALYIALTTPKKLTIKDCKCRVIRGKLKTCKFHKKCIGMPCATALNICDNPKHQEEK